MQRTSDVEQRSVCVQTEPYNEEAEESISSTENTSVSVSPYNTTTASVHYEHDYDKLSFKLHDRLDDKLKQARLGPLNKKTAIDNQLERSEVRLEELVNFGKDLVNNIKAYNEKFKVAHAQSIFRRNEELQEIIRIDDERSKEKLNEINVKWDKLLDIKEPMAFHEEMTKLQKDIMSIMNNKDDIISICQEELNRANEKYIDNQTNQCSDVMFLMNRVDNQIELLKNAYESNVAELTQTIHEERERILSEKDKNIRNMCKKVVMSGKKTLEIIRKKEDFYRRTIDKLMNKQEDITRVTKMRLEKRGEKLEIELRNVYTDILLNAERMDYNFQLMRKRFDENIIITNQQKRRVSKRLERVSHLRRYSRQLKHITKVRLRRLTNDIEKMNTSITVMSAKLSTIRLSNNKKFNEIWDINFQEIKNIFDSIRKSDTSLYSQLLDNQSDIAGLNMDAFDLLKNTPAPTISTDSSETMDLPDPEIEPIDYDYLRHILMKIANRSGFLQEDKLIEILTPYSDVEDCLVRMENVFVALDIRDTNLIELLIKYFKPYSYCPNCAGHMRIKFLESIFTKQCFSEMCIHLKAINRNQGDPNCENHYLTIEPTLVLFALNEFVAAVKDRNKRTHKNDIKPLLDLSEEDITDYWNQFYDLIPKDKPVFWQCLAYSLSSYSKVLKKREGLSTECKYLNKEVSGFKFLSGGRAKRK